MSNELDFRYKLLEQKVEVMQKEVSQVLNEMQTTILAITQTYSTALKVLLERVDSIEKKVGLDNKQSNAEEHRDGKEI